MAADAVIQAMMEPKVMVPAGTSSAGPLAAIVSALEALARTFTMAPTANSVILVVDTDEICGIVKCAMLKFLIVHLFRYL